MKLKLKAFQKTAIKFMLSRPAAGLFLDPGLGKTVCALTTIEILRDKGHINKTLVVAPLRPCYKVWPDEIKLWGFDLSYTILHGKGKKNIHNDSDVYIINYEGLEWFFSVRGRRDIDCLVLDESSKVRNTATRRFRLMRKNISRFKRRYILTGSPTPNGLINLFGQIFCLDGGRALGSFITHYRTMYFDQDPFSMFPKFIIKEDVSKKIYRKIKPLVIRFSDNQIKMPPKINIKCKVELTDYALEIYKEMADELITLIDKEVIRAWNSGVATHKLRQIANGAIYYGDKKKWKNVHDEKIERTLEIVEELEGQPALIAYEFKHDLTKLLKALPKGTPNIGGSVSMKETEKIIDAWNTGNVPIMLGQHVAVAHGLNLQAGRAVIWFGLTWDLEIYQQLIRRVWRQGQKHRVMIYHIIAGGTVDQLMIASLSGKNRTQENLFKALIRHLKEIK